MRKRPDSQACVARLHRQAHYFEQESAPLPTRALMMVGGEPVVAFWVPLWHGACVFVCWLLLSLTLLWLSMCSHCRHLEAEIYTSELCSVLKLTGTTTMTSTSRVFLLCGACISAVNNSSLGLVECSPPCYLAARIHRSETVTQTGKTQASQDEGVLGTGLRSSRKVKLLVDMALCSLASQGLEEVRT